MAWKNRIRERSQSVMAQHGNKLVTTVISMASMAVALWVYTNFVNRPVSVIQDAIATPALVAKVSSNFETHLVREKDYREKQAVKYEDLEKRLRDLELTVSFLKGKSR